MHRLELDTINPDEGRSKDDFSSFPAGIWCLALDETGLPNSPEDVFLLLAYLWGKLEAAGWITEDSRTRDLISRVVSFPRDGEDCLSIFTPVPLPPELENLIVESWVRFMDIDEYRIGFPAYGLIDFKVATFENEVRK